MTSSSSGGSSQNYRAASTVRGKNPSYLECCKLGYTINNTRILSNIDLLIPPGRLVALMGPSGAGKTTLLDVLDGRGRGMVDGKITLNNITVTRSLMRHESKLVPQHDILMPCLTARETLQYTAELALSSNVDRTARVDEVLSMLSINNCADVVCGGFDHKGLSGGQLKRVSIGMELIQDPSVLLLDEPTSGLDSKVAEDVVELVRALAQGGRTVICTIHQPSFQVFSKFDWLIMLDKGCVAYNGEVKGLADYLVEIGCPCPTFINPTDHLMQILSEPAPISDAIADIEQGSRGSGLTDTQPLHNPGFNALFYSTSFGTRVEKDIVQQRVLRDALQCASSRLLMDKHSEYSNSFLSQMWTIFRRAMYTTYKDKSQLRMRVAQIVFMGLIIVTIFLRMENTQKRAQDRLSVMFLMVLMISMSSIMSTAMALPDEKQVFLREVHNGYYALPAFFLGRISVLVLFQALYGVVFAAAVYWPLGLYWAALNFFILLACMALISTISGIAGFVAGTIFPTPQQATNMVPMIIMPLIIFAGLFIAYDAIPKYWIWLYYISFFQYTIQIMMVNEFEDTHFEPCLVHEIMNPTGSCPYGSCSADVMNPQSCPGTVVLERLNYDVNNLPRNFGILIAYVFCLLGLGAFFLRRLVNKNK